MNQVAIHPMGFLRVACAVSYILVATLLATPLPQERLNLKRLTSDTKARKDEQLNRVIGEVRVSFMERDAEELADCFGEGKVYLSLKSRTGETGYYTKSQLQFIFDRMFQELRTRAFEYSSSDISIPDENRAHFRSEWTYVVLGSDSLVTEHLHFTLVREKDGWRISEIKASSR